MFWVIAIPGISLLICTLMKDQMRMACYPIIVAILVIGFLLFFLSQYVLICAMIYGFKTPLIITIALNYVALIALVANNIIFRRKYAGKDI
jgi:hypothetical protein